MNKFLACLVLIVAASAQAESRKAKVIDLGDIEVNGDVRKPFVQVLDSDQAAVRLVPELSKEELERFEAKLVEFAKPDSKKKTGGGK